MKVICFSDVHLLLHSSPEEKYKLALFEEFLNYIKKEKPDKLIIAGDLFDVWYEYKLVIPKPYFHVLHKLAAIHELGTKLIYLVGNHDFKFLDFFDRYIPADIYQDYYKTTINNKKYFFSHGDKYTSNDLRYHILKSILRNRFINSLFGLIHPDLGLKFGRWMSRSSRGKQDTPGKIKRLEKGLIKFAQKEIQQGYDYVVMGHIHDPKTMNLNGGKYINLGDWIQHFSYLLIKNEVPELKFWHKTTDK
ncbi:MAG: UDP-2,3-diacylglucosamine diphosphatase [Candidatus Cloacimonetes bacterium]|nr:UDP-2,3-diacylglucosamine diphosphatase [Candidatus Cloacimonadota bacterium]